MSIKKGIMIIGAIIVGGFIIAGQTLGWQTFLPRFSSAQIVIDPVSRAPCNEFFADEKLWIMLTEVETDRVYWVFDESNDVIPGNRQIQYTFPFDETAPEGGKSSRRIDAFYKTGDDYQHVATRCPIINNKIQYKTSFGPEGLEFTLPTKLDEFWNLKTVKLSKLSNGEFINVHLEPDINKQNLIDAHFVWNGSLVASEFGYSSVEEARLRLMSDDTIWVSAEYTENNTGETLDVVKPVGVKSVY